MSFLNDKLSYIYTYSIEIVDAIHSLSIAYYDNSRTIWLLANSFLSNDELQPGRAVNGYPGTRVPEGNGTTRVMKA